MAKRTRTKTKAKWPPQERENQRERLLAIVRLAAALEALPPTKLVNETLIEAKAALARMCRQ